jgi:hypothetical protein
MIVSGGHVFISYIRDDSGDVDRLERALTVGGLQVWRDTAKLWPGDNWQIKIKQAIANDALVVIACFSRRSLARSVSYQNEELALAIDQVRLRQPGMPWLIPVRLDDCQVPDLDIGGGVTLRSLQWADLFGRSGPRDTARLVQVVHQILAQESREPSGPAEAGPRSRGTAGAVENRTGTPAWHGNMQRQTGALDLAMQAPDTADNSSSSLILDIGSAKGPNSFINVAEVRFTLSNCTSNTIKIPSLILRTVSRQESASIIGRTAAGPVGEHFLFARVRTAKEISELLSVHHLLRPYETDGFFLKIEAPEGYEYVFQLECSWKVIGEPDLNLACSHPLIIEFPSHTPQGMLAALERSRDPRRPDAD